MVVKVYFEVGPHKDAYLAAKFDNEEVYMGCLPALEKICKERGFNYVTEYFEYEEDL